MAPIFDTSHAILPNNPIAFSAGPAVEAIFWAAAQFYNAGETILTICHLPSSFIGWVVQVLTEALDWLYAIFANTVEIVVLYAGILVGCLLMLLVLVAVCKSLRRGWMYREKTSCKVLIVPAMDRCILDPKQERGSVDQLCYGTMGVIPPGTTISRKTIEERHGLGWWLTISKNVTAYSYASRGSTNGGGIQSGVQTRNEKSDNQLGG